MRKIAGPVPDIPLEYVQILKEGGKFWDDVNGGYVPEDLVLAARREEIDWVHSQGVYEIVPVQECKDAGMKPFDLVWVDTDTSVDPTRKKIRSRLRAREHNTKKQGKIRRAPAAAQLFSAMPPLEALKVLVSIMMSVSLSETLRHQQSTFPRNSPETHLHWTFRRGSAEVCRRQKLADRSRAESWEASEEANTVQHVPQSKSRCENGSARR